MDLKLAASVAHDQVVRFWRIPEKAGNSGKKVATVKTVKAAEKQSFFSEL